MTCKMRRLLFRLLAEADSVREVAEGRVELAAGLSTRRAGCEYAAGTKPKLKGGLRAEHEAAQCQCQRPGTCP